MLMFLREKEGARELQGERVQRLVRRLRAQLSPDLPQLEVRCHRYQGTGTLASLSGGRMEP